METTDHDLMNRLCAGETDRLGDLYDRHASGVLRHCHRMVGEAGVARDLTQDVFLRVFRYRMSWQGRSRFTTWLYRITHNVCLDHLKREKRRRDILEEGSVAFPAPGVQPSPGVRPSPAAASEDPARRIEANESTERLEAALARLSPMYREVILLIRYQDMSYDEVSRVLDCTVNAARVRFYRAMQALRKEYMKSGRTTE